MHRKQLHFENVAQGFTVGGIGMTLYRLLKMGRRTRPTHQSTHDFCNDGTNGIAIAKTKRIWFADSLTKHRVSRG